MSFPFLQPYAGLSNSLQTAQAGGAGGPSVGGWVELGRTTLGSVGDTISVSSLSDKRYYMILANTKTSGTVAGVVRLNNDSGSNYSLRRRGNFGATGTSTSSTFMYNLDVGTTSPNFNIGYISNLSTKEKLAINNTVVQTTAGAGNAPTRRESVGKHAQTSNPISQIDAINVESGNFDTGSELVVLGWDPADTHTTNFWEELASVEGDGTSAILDSGTILAKKYLWVQVFADTGSTASYGVAINSDTGSNYAWRESRNGGGDNTLTSQTEMQLTGGDPDPVFINGFMINNSANEKLCIWNINQGNTAGAGTAPERREQVGKWTNTSSQITKLEIKATAGNFTANSIIKVWGSD